MKEWIANVSGKIENWHGLKRLESIHTSVKIGAVTCFLKFFCQAVKYVIRGYWNQTIFTTHKVWWLREASQIGQTFIPYLVVYYMMFNYTVKQTSKRTLTSQNICWYPSSSALATMMRASSDCSMFIEWIQMVSISYIDFIFSKTLRLCRGVLFLPRPVLGWVGAHEAPCRILSEWGQWYPASRSLFPSTPKEKF